MKIFNFVIRFIVNNPKFCIVVLCIFLAANVWGFIDQRLSETMQIDSFVEKYDIDFQFVQQSQWGEHHTGQTITLRSGNEVSYGQNFTTFYVDEEYSKHKKEVKIKILSDNFENFEIEEPFPIVPVTVIGLGIMILGYVLFIKKDPYKPSAY